MTVLPSGYNVLMRRYLYLAGLLLFTASVLLAERVQDLPAPTNYVNDFAGVLSPATRTYLNSLCAAVDRQAHAQIAVVTIKSLDGEPIENFTTALEEKWKVGTKGTDRGAILVLAANDRRYRIEVGYGLEGILPDGKTGNIGRSMIPYLRQGNYDQAAATAVTQMAQTIAADAGVTLNVSAPRGPPQRQPHSLTGGQLLLLAGLIFLVILVLSRLGGSGLMGFLIGAFLGGGWGGGGRGGGDWGGGGGGGGFGGFGGGSSGGGGASGSW